MKRLCLLAAVLGLLPAAMAEKIEITAHYVEIPSAMQPTVDMTLLQRMDKAEVIKLPVVTTESGQMTKITSGKDFPVPGHDAVFTGVIIHLTPTKEGEKINFIVDAEETRFSGYANLRTAFATPEAPAFTSRRVFGLTGSTLPAVATMLEIRPTSDPLSDARTKVFLILKFAMVE
jgi:Flp pilus assembly secretin CpaC